MSNNIQKLSMEPWYISLGIFCLVIGGLYQLYEGFTYSKITGTIINKEVSYITIKYIVNNTEYINRTKYHNLLSYYYPVNGDTNIYYDSKNPNKISLINGLISGSLSLIIAFLIVSIL